MDCGASNEYPQPMFSWRIKKIFYEMPQGRLVPMSKGMLYGVAPHLTLICMSGLILVLHICFSLLNLNYWCFTTILWNFQKNWTSGSRWNLPPSYLPYRFLHNLHSFLLWIMENTFRICRFSNIIFNSILYTYYYEKYSILFYILWEKVKISIFLKTID